MKKESSKRNCQNHLFPFSCLLPCRHSIYGKFETKTVTGEILDMKCYMTSGAHGPEHKDCAVMCVKGGSPMGILADDGKVYLLIESKDGAAAFEETKNTQAKL